jgi:hypothetical protein
MGAGRENADMRGGLDFEIVHNVHIHQFWAALTFFDSHRENTA